MTKKVRDIDINRITKQFPDKSLTLLTDGKNESQGFIIEHIELRQYIENVDPSLGNYSLLTVFIKTDKGEVEMKYDEGFRGINVIESAAMMITQYAGLSALINRALIELQR
ncbi:MAG TPA: hypothetical protein VJ729_17850 [Nitrososphaeraceae archaeon]|jgi:hypothetical protein|nr:hypothetical protein [Nitrososphaeraceae archaeon]